MMAARLSLILDIKAKFWQIYVTIWKRSDEIINIQQCEFNAYV